MTMKNQFPILTKLFSRTSLTVLAGIGFASCLLPQVSWAQAAYPTYSTQVDEFKTQEQDPLTGSNNGGFNPLDLIHRANLGALRTYEEFSAEQNTNLNSATDDFKKQQLEMIRKMNQNSATGSGSSVQKKN
ncbi:hypothetical protein Cri9333_4045 [Crinalium epipsammum PCC 9333]|uniref:Low temperature-induced protein n=1 Tax=Crinalium epipsammum PCC 9333 TaxID=1173022 RepID=K9W5U6_9CYAN|nr:hypothetical protein [Crinalium epipsammum]AFZ14850.1 hypothetical protein Cri9333_4045 [Crinalium epipsammum PCC 9333]